MDDDHETRLVAEPPAPQTGDIVQYQEFLEIILDVLEDRWLIGERPDISDLAGNSDLRSVLNQQVVDMARAAHEVGSEIRDDEVSSETIDSLDTELEEFEAVLNEIERRHLE
jgi:hypothetical protein